MESSPLPTPSQFDPPGAEGPKGPVVVSVTSGGAVDVGGSPLPPQRKTLAQVFGGEGYHVTTQYPVGKPTAFKPALRSMEAQASPTTERLMRQNEHLIRALVETNEKLMRLVEQLARTTNPPETLNQFEDFERLQTETEELQNQVERMQRKRDEEKPRGHKHGGK